MDLDKINYSLGFLLESRSEDIYRMKGILSIAGSEYRFVYQVRGGSEYRFVYQVRQGDADGVYQVRGSKGGYEEFLGLLAFSGLGRPAGYCQGNRFTRACHWDLNHES